MHISNLRLPTALAALLLAVTPVFAQGPPMGEHGDHSPLAQSMKTIQMGFRTLKRQISDPTKKDDSVKLVAKMKDAVKKSETYEPPSAADLPAAEKPAFIADYKKQLEGVAATLDKLSAAITAGDTATASKLLDTINQEKREGHGKFNSDD
jgi:hypothetical protein